MCNIIAAFLHLFFNFNFVYPLYLNDVQNITLAFKVDSVALSLFFFFFVFFLQILLSNLELVISYFRLATVIELCAKYNHCHSKSSSSAEEMEARI